MAQYLRGQLAKKANLNIETLRYYENINLIPEPERTEKGYRIYPEEILHKLEFIKVAKESGFSLDELRKLFSMANQDCVDISDVIKLITKKIDEIEASIKKMEAMKGILCEALEKMNEPLDCPVIKYFFGNIIKK